MAYNNTGIGFHSMWGFSPSRNFLDIQHQSSTKKKKEQALDDSYDNNQEPLNILLVEPSDPRHIIHTISRRHRQSSKSQNKKVGLKKNRPINFYILETQSEVIARHILLLHILFDDEIQIRQRAALFLEVFGNSLVQKKTEVYIGSVGTLLRELIFDDDRYNGRLKTITNFDHLKQRERDEIEKVFKSWTSCEQNEFDAILLRDHRLRGYYGERYDCRLNLIDWDYHANVKDVASIIHIRQFQEWRMSGIAFEFGDATYSSPNRSMASYVQGKAKSGRDSGMLKEFQGFWLDIVVGPYISFGVKIDSECSNAKQLFDVVNKGSGAEQHRHHTVDVAMYNILGYIWEIETGQEYQMKKERDIFSGLGETSELKVLDNAFKGVDLRGKEECTPKDENNAKVTDGIKIIPIKGSLKSIANKKKYNNLFDHVHLSQQSSHQLGEGYLKTVLKNDSEHCSHQSRASVETPKYLFALKEKIREDMKAKVVDMGRKNNFVNSQEDKSSLNDMFFEMV